MSKQNWFRNKKANLKQIPRRFVVVAMALLFGAAAVLPIARARADSFQDQINALNAQNAQSQNSLSALQMQAASYQDAINQLQAQISGLEDAINANQAKQADLESQIEAAQVKLDQQRAGLGQDLKAMYVSGQMSTVEMLATSKSLSDYINAETYSSAVQNKIQATLAEITSLQNQLKTQKDQVAQLITLQQQQQANLAATKSQQQSLLAMNESQQATFNQQIKDNSSKIAQLRAAQAAANRSLNGQVIAGDPGHGGYPARWDAPVPQDSLIDSWDMYNRECVSYAAWKVYQTYGINPTGFGNAIQWPGSARAAGISTGSTPKVNSVAIWPVGYFGHAMWVEAVSGNMIYVSQYNYDYQGHYSEMWVNGSNFTYIYFGQ